MLNALNKKQIAVAALLAFFVLVIGVTAILYYFRYSDASVELSSIRRDLEISQSETRLLREDLRRAKAEQESVPGKPDSRTPSQQSTSPLDRLATSTREMLLSFAPFSEEQYIDIKELGDNLVFIIDEASRQDEEYFIEGLSAWFVDFDQEEMRRLIGGVGGYCDYLELENWSGGIVALHSSSPCEAVGKTHSYYFDENAEIVAEIEVGTFDRDGTEIDAVVRGSALKAKLVQAGNCRDVDPYLSSGEATTTVSGISVNGRVFLLPTSIQVECSDVYGGGFDDYYFPYPEFSGQNITFHLPGYDAELSRGGMISFSSLPAAYYIPKYGRRIIREDRTGFHVVRPSIMSDPIFEGRVEITRDYPAYYFDVESMEEGIMKIKISRFNSILNIDEDTGITVEYDTAADHFQSLTVN